MTGFFWTVADWSSPTWMRSLLERPHYVQVHQITSAWKDWAAVPEHEWQALAAQVGGTSVPAHFQTALSFRWSYSAASGCAFLVAVN
ncbi:hypothetical protein [Deinococcus radiophilus]|uniref:hypothetical protein n=1 Tax=Deinococcus radiophilus TaxID=32062 RepID=UPI00360D7A99